MGMKILLTGGNGMVGRLLTKQLHDQGYEVLFLSSSGRKSTHSFRWNIQDGIIDPIPLKEIDAVVHLAGAGIADKKWTVKRKKEILDSRVKASRFLFDAFQKEGYFPKYYISASGTGVYPVDTNTEYTEDADFATTFPAKVCKEWENEAQLFAPFSKVYLLRFGVILGNAGFLKEILKPAAFFAGAVLGTGKQYVPWVHVSDVVSVIQSCLFEKLTPGIFNVVAPSHNNLGEISKLAARKIQRPIWLPPIPSFVVKLLFGERSLLLLGSQKVSAKKLVNQDFKFLYSDLNKALDSLLPFKK